MRDLPLEERERLGVAREGRGRPRTIALAPARPDVYLQQLSELREEATALDPVVAAATDPERAAEVLDRTMFALAVECASLKFDRVQAEKRGVDVGALCSRRVAGLAQIASLFCERRRHEPDRLDVRGEKVQKIVANFMEVLREAAEETLGPDAQAFLASYAVKLSGWEDRVDP